MFAVWNPVSYAVQLCDNNCAGGDKADHDDQDYDDNNTWYDMTRKIGRTCRPRPRNIKHLFWISIESPLLCNVGVHD